jgi:hypothetical protein
MTASMESKASSAASWRRGRRRAHSRRRERRPRTRRGWGRARRRRGLCIRFGLGEHLIADAGVLDFEGNHFAQAEAHDGEASAALAGRESKSRTKTRTRCREDDGDGAGAGRDSSRAERMAAVTASGARRLGSSMPGTIAPGAEEQRRRRGRAPTRMRRAGRARRDEQRRGRLPARSRPRPADGLRGGEFRFVQERCQVRVSDSVSATTLSIRGCDFGSARFSLTKVVP